MTAPFITALSVRQPWADLIAAGIKSLEIRTWRTSFRGPLLICSSRHGRLPRRGVAICIVDLVDCRPMRPDDVPLAECGWTPGLWAWVLGDPRPAPTVPVVGRLGLFRCSLSGMVGEPNPLGDMGKKSGLFCGSP